jgi:O-antigen/teichoic acid export membrane protein
MGAPLMGLAVAGPIILLFWLLRRACYLDGRAPIAMHASLLYALLLFMGLWATWVTESASSLVALLILGISSMGASLLLMWLLGINLQSILLRCSRATLVSLLVKHWAYGKWVVGSSFVHWAGTAGYIPLIGGLAGLSQAGALRAIQNLILPLQQVLAGLANLWLPSSAKLFVEQGKDSLRRNLKKMILYTLLLSAPYLVIVLVYSEPIITLLYGVGRYDEFQWLNYYLVVFAIFGVVSQGFSIALKALQRPDGVFYSQVGTAAITATVGSFLVWTLELEGAAIGLNLSALMGALILFNRLQFSFKQA